MKGHFGAKAQTSLLQPKKIFRTKPEKMSVGYIEGLLLDQKFFKLPDKRQKVVRWMVEGKPIHPSRPSNKVFQNRKEKTQ